MYIVFVNHGVYEGWKLFAKVDTFAEAFVKREEALSEGNYEVIIVKSVDYKVEEV